MAKFATEDSTLDRLKLLPTKLWVVIALAAVCAVAISIVIFSQIRAAESEAATRAAELAEANLILQAEAELTEKSENRRIENAPIVMTRLEEIALEEAKLAAELEAARQAREAEAAKNRAEYVAYVNELLSGTVILSGVPFHSQMPDFPTGCEAASVSMLVSYATGRSVSVADIVNAMPYSSNPYYGFVGNPRDWSGWTIYPEAMLGTVSSYTGSVVNLTGTDLATIKTYLDAGKPVVTWISISSGLHCVIVVGYDAGQIIYHDPYYPAFKYVSAVQFDSMWAGLRYRALSY